MSKWFPYIWRAIFCALLGIWIYFLFPEVSPLRIAATKGDREKVERLLNAGANPNVKDSSGRMPLHWASAHNQIAIIPVLLDHGALIDQIDDSNATPLHWAVMRRKIESAKILLERGANPNIFGHQGDTPLHIAAERNDLEMVKLLLASRASKEERNEANLRPYQKASDPEVIKLLSPAVLEPEVSRKPVEVTGGEVSIPAASSASGLKLAVILAFLGAALYSLAAWGWGVRILAWLSPTSLEATPASQLGHWATEVVLGQAVLALIWLVFAVFGKFSAPLVWILCGAGVLVGGLDALRRIPRMAKILYALCWKITSEGTIWRLFTITVLSTFIFQAISSVTAPADCDSRFYYLIQPQIIADTGSLIPVPSYELFFHAPFLAELHTAALMAVANENTARAMLPIQGIWAVLLLVALGLKHGMQGRGAWVVWVAFLSMGEMSCFLLFGKIDLYPLALACAALYWTADFWTEQNKYAVRLAGLFTGLAIMSKMTYLVTLLPAIVCLLFWRRYVVRKSTDISTLPGNQSLSAALFQLGLWVSIPFVVLLIKNSVILHEPFAPFLYFHPQKSLLETTWLTKAQTHKLLLIYPLYLFFGSIYHLSPVFPAFGLLAWHLPRRERWIENPNVQCALCGVLAAILFVALRPGAPGNRFLIFGFLAASPLIAQGIEAALTRAQRWKSASIMALRVMVLFTLLLTSLTMASISAARAFEPSPPDSMRLAMETLNKVASNTSKIGLITSGRYRLRTELVLKSELWFPKAGPDEKNIWQQAYDQGFEYLACTDIFQVQLRTLKTTVAPPNLKISTLASGGDYGVFKIERVP